MSDSGSTAAGRQLGSHIREARSALDLSIRETARGVPGISASVLQRLERGNPTRVTSHQLEELCRFLRMDEDDKTMIPAMIGLLQKAGEISWWHEYGDLIPHNFDVYVGLESDAHRISGYHPLIIPGLLQTPGYAMEVLRNGYPGFSESDLRRLLELRMKRQIRLSRKHRTLELDIVLNEAALRCVVGGPGVMAEQLAHLAEIGKQDNVSISILPFTAGIPLGNQIGQYNVLDFRDASAPPVVYVESVTGSMYLEKPREVARFRDVTSALRGHTLGEDGSRTMLREMGKEYTSG